MLLTVIGKHNFSLLQNLVAPESPKDKSFDDLTKILKSHFEPKKLVIAERFNFYQCDQQDGESTMDFVADLRCLNCEFEVLDQALRDHFVCGLKSESAQKHLSEDKLNFSKAIEIAQGVESAESKAKEFKGLPPAVFEVSPHQQKGEKKPCHCCGRSNHSEQVCRFRQATCHNYGTQLPPVGRARPQVPRDQMRNSPEHTKFVELETTNSDPEELPLFTLGEKATNPINADILINGRNLPMELDTGAAAYQTLPGKQYSPPANYRTRL